jgi:hypothetical protein
MSADVDMAAIRGFEAVGYEHLAVNLTVAVSGNGTGQPTVLARP